MSLQSSQLLSMSTSVRLASTSGGIQVPHLHSILALDCFILLIMQKHVYKWVMEDVIKNVREEFLNEGVDLQVLDELKQVCHYTSGSLVRPAFY